MRDAVDRDGEDNGEAMLDEHGSGMPEKFTLKDVQAAEPLDLAKVEREIEATEDELENFRADTSLCDLARLMVAEIRSLRQKAR